MAYAGTGGLGSVPRMSWDGGTSGDGSGGMVAAATATFPSFSYKNDERLRIAWKTNGIKYCSKDICSLEIKKLPRKWLWHKPEQAVQDRCLNTLILGCLEMVAWLLQQLGHFPRFPKNKTMCVYVLPEKLMALNIVVKIYRYVHWR